VITLPHGKVLHLVRRVIYHVPGRGFVTVDPGTPVTVVGLNTLSPETRRAVEASARRDEVSRGVQMVLVHVLGQPRLMDAEDVFPEDPAEERERRLDAEFAARVAQRMADMEGRTL